MSTDNVAPTQPDQGRSAGTQILIVALGILLAVVVVLVVYYIAHANDGMNCSLDNLDRAQRGEPTATCPD